MDNYKGANSWGGEIQLEAKYKTGRISAWYTYSGFDEEARQDENNILRAYPPARHKVGLAGRWFMNDVWTFNINYRYTDVTPYDPGAFPPPNPCVAAEPSHRFDLTMAKKINKDKGELMFGVLNVLNKENGIMQDRGTTAPHETPGRTFFVQLSHRF